MTTIKKQSNNKIGSYGKIYICIGCKKAQKKILSHHFTLNYLWAGVDP